jgi:hypothetical protein
VRGPALREPDVAVQRRVRKEVAGGALQDHPDLGAPQARDLRVGELAHVVGADVDPPGGRPHQAGEQGDQRRLARAGRPHQGDRLSRSDRQIDAGQCNDVAGLGAVDVYDASAGHGKSVHVFTLAKIGLS